MYFNTNEVSCNFLYICDVKVVVDIVFCRIHALLCFVVEKHLQLNLLYLIRGDNKISIYNVEQYSFGNVFYSICIILYEY